MNKASKALDFITVRFGCCLDDDAMVVCCNSLTRMMIRSEKNFSGADRRCGHAGMVGVVGMIDESEEDLTFDSIMEDTFAKFLRRISYTRTSPPNRDKFSPAINGQISTATAASQTSHQQMAPWRRSPV